MARDCIQVEDTLIALPVAEIGPALCSITEDEFNDMERTQDWSYLWNSLDVPTESEMSVYMYY